MSISEEERRAKELREGISELETKAINVGANEDQRSRVILEWGRAGYWCKWEPVTVTEHKGIW